MDEIEEVLAEIGLEVVRCIGILSSSEDVLYSAAKEKFGLNVDENYGEMRERVPEEFLGSVIASCFPEAARENLYICKRVR
jgi:hypothetical protein